MNRIDRPSAFFARLVIPLLAGSVLVFGAAAAPSDDPPPWAYGFGSPPPAPASAPNQPAPAPAPASASASARDDGAALSLAGSSATFTLAQIRDGFGPADWHPGDHPEMPGIVARGRRPEVRACALCHYPNGKGRPENAGISGLPEAYFVQTMLDFKNGARRSAEPRKANTNLMIAYAKAMTDEEVKAAASYFGSMKWSPWIKVIETNTVPKTRIAGGMFVALADAGTEPIGRRIIEVPEQTHRTEVLRDPRSGFIAYVPGGSLRRGRVLVTSGGNSRTIACGICHGADLQGMGPVPGIAGRSPSYLVRQLYDMKARTRSSEWTELMQPVVARLSIDDMIAIAAYSASLPVGAPDGRSAGVK